MSAHDRADDLRLLRLREALENLAKSAGEQIGYLKTLGTYPSADELGLQFDDVAASAIDDERLLTTQQRHAVRSVDELLNAMSGPAHAELWTGNALETRDEWRRVREAAGVALERLADVS